MKNLDPAFFASFYTASPKILQLDVDSTLIEQEAIEVLARHAGQAAKVHAITEAAMRGEIDFKRSLIERVRLLRGLPADIMAGAAQELTLSPGAGEAIAAYRHAGHYVGLCSGGFMQILEPLARHLEVDYAVANVIEVEGGRITGELTGNIVTSVTKAEILMEKTRRFKVDPSHSIAVGDGANDIDVLCSAGVGVAYCAKPALRQVADIILDTPDLSLLKVLDSTTDTKATTLP